MGGSGQTNEGRYVLPLGGTWRVAKDPENSGIQAGWFRRPHDSAVETPVPRVIQAVFPGYHGVAWYWTEWEMPPHPHPRGRAVFRFGQVDYRADVWVNGEPIGSHEGGDGSFELDGTGAVKPGANLLAVRVLNPTGEGIDGYRLREVPRRVITAEGGIHLPVELLLAPEVRIADAFLRPDWRSGEVSVALTTVNASAGPQARILDIGVGPARDGHVSVSARFRLDIPPGESVSEVSLRVPGHRLWSLESPHLYRATLRLCDDRFEQADQVSVRFGFRHFAVEDGYFCLNGSRIFVRGMHTAPRSPVEIWTTPAAMPDILRRDILYAKASGFNMIRFLAGPAHPDQLDLCDEIGMLVYEEGSASWVLADSPYMEERFDASVAQTIRRDRNHPSIVIWGLLNETHNGPVFKHAVRTLELVRSLDPTRLVLLNSGRWDHQPSIGSVSNPYSDRWEHVWGREAEDTPDTPFEPLDREPNVPAGCGIPGYARGAGDAHLYPHVPHTPQTVRIFRNLGSEGKPVFLSEYGIGNLMNVIAEMRAYEEAGANPDDPVYRHHRRLFELLQEDWKLWGFDDVYPTLEDMLEEAEARMATYRLRGFDLIRANPRICGYSLTSLADNGSAAEGVWRLWRRWKPGAMDALKNGWSPLRWSLFVSPMHGYAGRTADVEAVLANESVLRPGTYPVRLTVSGPEGVVWRRRTELRIDVPPPGGEVPLAQTVHAEAVRIDGPPGAYRLTADLEHGGAPANRSLVFYVSEAAPSIRLDAPVRVWGIPERARRWLEAKGVRCEPFGDHVPAIDRRELLLVGDVSDEWANEPLWRELARRMARGGFALFLSERAFQLPGRSSPHHLDLTRVPLAQKGTCLSLAENVYHKECLARPHPVFDGLQARGILDWDYYGALVPTHFFSGQPAADEVIAVALAVGYVGLGKPSKGYESGTTMAKFRFGAGSFLLNSFSILEHLDMHPAADRLLTNLVRYGAGHLAGPVEPLDPAFEEQLRAIGYSKGARKAD